MEQSSEKDKHLQTCKSVAKAAPLSHAEDQNLVCQFLVKLSRWSQEAVGAKCFWITPEITGSEVNIQTSVQSWSKESNGKKDKGMWISLYTVASLSQNALSLDCGDSLIMIDLILVNEDAGIFGNEISIQGSVACGTGMKQV